MIAIRNKDQLISNGGTPSDRKARGFALESLEAAVRSVDPKAIIKSKIIVKGSILKVNGCSFDLDRFKKIYVVGAGKASGVMGEAIEQLLGKWIVAGHVNVPRGDKANTRTISLSQASHPVPDEEGMRGSEAILNVADQASKDKALMISMISGGGSSLMPLPRKGITLEDKRSVTDALLKCGATINEINTVRKHVSLIKGGWLAKKAYPATVLNLILSDVMGDPLDFIASGPTVPDSTTFADAVKVLKKYDIWDNTPESIRKVLSKGERGLVPETPKADDEAFKKVRNFVIGNNRFASTVARNHLKSKRLRALLLTATMEGEARHVGTLLGSIGAELIVSGNPVRRPAGIVAGGETTVVVRGKGLGGRNQEIPLAASMKFKGLEGIAVASLTTDGVDGPTDAAGAIADGKTLSRALTLGLEAEEFLAENDSYHFFRRLDDLIFTGPTGTNVNDISVIVAV
jgi:glycerate-2-kinase